MGGNERTPTLPLAAPGSKGGTPKGGERGDSPLPRQPLGKRKTP